MCHRFFNLIIVIFFTLIINASSNAAAKERQGTMMFGDQVDGTHITHLVNLPDVNDLNKNGDYFDLGWAHTRTRFFMIPMWGSIVGNYVLYTKRGYGWEYYNISKNDAAIYGNRVGLTLAQMPHVKPYQNYIGSVLFLGLLGIFIALITYANYSRKNKLRAQEIEVSDIKRMKESLEMEKIKANLNYHRGKDVLPKK
jgi:hypothetical protein